MPFQGSIPFVSHAGLKFRGCFFGGGICFHCYFVFWILLLLLLLSFLLLLRFGFLCFCLSALCFCCFSALAAVLLSLFAFPIVCFLTFGSGVLLRTRNRRIIS